jgi:hypothetical protein
MRVLVVLLLLIIGSEIHGQTDSIEKAVLFKMVSFKVISKSEFSTISKKWNATISKNRYPDLPFNNNYGKVQYSFIRYFQYLNKEKLFNRILEWLSINYGLIPAYLYSNLEDGKIICSNKISISDNTSSTYAYIFTIKDEKILLDISNISFQVTNFGYYSGDTWIPDNTKNYSIDQVFPIILKDPLEWDFYFNLLYTIDKQCYSEINSLCDYIANYDKIYFFD